MVWVMMDSTAKMSTERFQKYLTDIRQWAAEFLNYRLPEPNEIEEGSNNKLKRVRFYFRRLS